MRIYGVSDTIAKFKLWLHRESKREIFDKDIIRNSGYFDEGWYINNYPYVSYYPGGALDHYYRYAATEQTQAGPRFDTRAYLLANPDVAASGRNPLVHYVRHGIQEKRGFSSAANVRVRDASHQSEDRNITFSFLLIPGDDARLAATLDSLSAYPSGAFEIVHCIDNPARHALEKRFDLHTTRAVRVEARDTAHFIRAAVPASSSTFVIALDPGDRIAPEALYELARFIGRRACDVVYGDERHRRAGSAAPVIPSKPGWSPEMLTAFDYFGRPTAIRRSLALAALPSETSGSAAEWDLHLRMSERTRAIEHLPVVLCDRMVRSAVDPRLPEGDGCDHAAVLQQYWRRRGHDARIARTADRTFDASWPLAKRPSVSIIVSAHYDRESAHLDVENIVKNTSYDNIETIIVCGTQHDVFSEASHGNTCTGSSKFISVIDVDNFSLARNAGARVATGELLLFLGKDVAVSDPGWLDHLVQRALEPGVGVVGAKLLCPDRRSRRAGVAPDSLNLVKPASHTSPDAAWDPVEAQDTAHNRMAVSGVCQLLRRAVFDCVGGYDEAFPTSHGGTVLCIDAARAGFRTVYAPSAVLLHREAAPREVVDSPDDRVLLARRLRALGLARPPYPNPGRAAEGVEARHGTGHGADAIEAVITGLAGPFADPLDLFDDGAVAAAAGVPWDAVTWTFDPAHLPPGAAGGARILIEFIRRRRDLRKRFPRALSEGATGGFAAWTRSEGLALLGLGPDQAAWIDAAFASDAGAASRQHLCFDDALRASQPLFLLPEGRKAACKALFASRATGQPTFEDIWWFLIQNAEAPFAALCETWAITPSWQDAVPDGGTVFGTGELARWVGETYGARDPGLYAQEYPLIMSDAAQVRLAYEARPDWRVLFPEAMTDAAQARALLRHLTTRASGLPFLPRRWAGERLDGTLPGEIVRPGLAVLGHFAYPSGLRISAESLVQGLRENGVTASLRDVPVSLASDDPIGHRFRGFEVYDTTLIHVQPEPLFARVYEAAGLARRRKPPYRIGYWYWEFDEVPAAWNRVALDCDEIWTATRFIAEGLRKRYRQPIRVLAPGIEIAPFAQVPRSELGIEEGVFVFLFVFHMVSVMERKNPLALIRAFKRAFPERARAKLVIKTSFGDRNPDALASLRRAAEGADIEVIDAVYSRDRTLSLIAACDAYVSLHRCEGLGLTMAEAMLLGRPVIATRYSGNLDFMDDGNSLLVDGRTVTLDHDIAPYEAGLRWAEPSVAHAAELMRKLYDDPAAAAELGARARSDIRARLNYRAAGAAMARRLAEIARMA